MARNTLLLATLVLLVSVSVCLAHWDETEPAKWVQLPDESELGIDVNASEGLILADDFKCTEPGLITDVHIWGSWYNDILPAGHPDSVMFVLSFHEDIPDSESGTGYSMPGDIIMYRFFEPWEFTSRVWLDGAREGWLDPPDLYEFPADYVIWQYNFPFPDGAFFQEGTVDSPIVYWLNVKAFPYDGQARFGWKTSWEHNIDDAVWGQGDEPYLGPWFELRYPPGHELVGHSIDLAFVIVGEEPEKDWGDAPEIPGGAGYPTTAANAGANHVIGGPWLGDAADNPDPEANGQPHPTAVADDLTGYDDENGVQIPVLSPGVTSTITYEVNGMDAFVAGWIDFNADQIWQAGELVVSGAHTVGVYSISVTPPAATVIGQTFSRWRISTAGGMTPTGGSPDGEVEDHLVVIADEPSKWLQRPDLSPQGIDVEATDPVILADDFLCTEPGRITEIVIWGSWFFNHWPWYEDPGDVEFTLSFHEDIPASESATGYSMPGDPVWWRDFVPGEFGYWMHADSLREGWLYPPDGYYYFPADSVCWGYRFSIDPEEAFFQSGSLYHPKVYWLDVQARPMDPNAVFGWKTSVDHWNDDAVWGDGNEPYSFPWFELIYPWGHPQETRSIDLAFRLRNDPASGVPSQRETHDGLGLFQNVPNPFAASTSIAYALPSETHVKLEVFSVTGRLVDVLVDETQSAGMKSATWDGMDTRGNEMPAGIYFYRVSAEGETRTMKMLLLK